jgi:hypothetical protein
MMTTQTVTRLQDQKGAEHRNGSECDCVVKPVLIRLNEVPATVSNRRRLAERVRRLNRSLEESGTPFRLRVL